MKAAFIIFLASIVTTQALTRRQPELLVYEVSEKNGEPQVNLVRAEDIPVDANVNAKPGNNQMREYRDSSLNIPNSQPYFGSPKGGLDKSLKKYFLNSKNNVAHQRDYSPRQMDYEPTQADFSEGLDTVVNYDPLENDVVPRKSLKAQLKAILDPREKTFNARLYNFLHPKRQNYFDPRVNSKGFNFKEDDDLYEQAEREDLKNKLSQILQRLDEIDARSKKPEALSRNVEGNPIFVGTLTEEEARHFLGSHAQNNDPSGYTLQDLPENDDRDLIDEYSAIPRAANNGYNSNDEEVDRDRLN